MPLSRIETILVPTDFSDADAVAFAHALKLALVIGAELDIFHVEPNNEQTDWHWAPSVLATLRRWGVLGAHAGENEMAGLGVRARRTVATGMSPDAGILQEMVSARADLVVMATQGRSGIETWTRPSVSVPVATRGSVPVLVVPSHARGFVSPGTGAGAIRRVLVPIDYRPDPGPAYAAVPDLVRPLAAEDVEVATMHVGSGSPQTAGLVVPETWSVRRLDQPGGDVVDAIVRTAEAWEADLVVMVTEGRATFLDALRGSTVERVLQRVKTPVLVVPAK
ncbi:MAG: universal stress protein [Myxococcota bacterium]